MTLSRRDIVAGLGLATTLAASASVSACSDPPPLPDQLPGSFFSAISGRRLEQAFALLAPDAKLSIFTADEQGLYLGPRDIVGKIGNLFHSLGLGMIGDRRDFAPGGMYWRPFGPWFLSDMLRPGQIDARTEATCGQPNNFVLNVFVRLTNGAAGLINSILLLESARLTIQWESDRPDPAFKTLNEAN